MTASNSSAAINGTTVATSHVNSHSSILLKMLADLADHRTSSEVSASITVGGRHLTLGDFIHVAKIRGGVTLNSGCKAAVDRCHQKLQERLKQSQAPIYGIGTGFGGSASVSAAVSSDVLRQFGLDLEDDCKDRNVNMLSGLLVGISTAGSADGGDPRPVDVMPSSWVRGAILLRINALLCGRSAVRWQLIERLAALLNYDLIPVVPVQGSISASGDLIPLAYVAAALSGDEAVDIVCKGKRKSAAEALAASAIPPWNADPREALSIVNGTAFSASVAAHALHQAHNLLGLAQVLTVAHTEAMLGLREAFDPLVHDVAMPHPGQVQVAATFRRWIGESTMIRDSSVSRGDDGRQAMTPAELLTRVVTGLPVNEDCKRKEDGTYLLQNRYDIRTAPQWLGPILENFTSAHESLEIDLNSASDNPIIDASGNAIHGGNFQSSSICNATEKTRDGLASIGRLIFAQQSQLLNVVTSMGLPPCLSPLKHSAQDGGLKGLDIANAAYLSELSFLANRVNHFMQSAEMHNQNVNGLALISARQTVQAAETLSKLLANATYTVLQAIDCRMAFQHFVRSCAGYLRFLLRPPPTNSSPSSPAAKGTQANGTVEEDEVFNALLHGIIFEMMRHSHLDVEKRCEYAAAALVRQLRRAGGPIARGLLKKLSPGRSQSSTSSSGSCSSPHSDSNDERAEGRIRFELRMQYTTAMEENLLLSTSLEAKQRQEPIYGPSVLGLGSHAGPPDLLDPQCGTDQVYLRPSSSAGPRGVTIPKDKVFGPCKSTRLLWTYIRRELGIPPYLSLQDLSEAAAAQIQGGTGITRPNGGGDDDDDDREEAEWSESRSRQRRMRTLGGQVSLIHDAIERGEVGQEVLRQLF